jgi:hypothetical protein
LRGIRAARDRSLRAARQAFLVAWWRAAADTQGLRVRFPLLDPGVTDLVVGLPQWVFATARRPKDLLRRAFHDRLPAVARERPKDQPHVEPWLRARVRAHGSRWVDECLREGALVSSGLLPLGAARSLLEGVHQGPPEVLYRSLAVLGTERWCRARGVGVKAD